VEVCGEFKLEKGIICYVQVHKERRNDFVKES